MTWFVASLVVVVFFVLLQLFSVPRRAGDVVVRAREALGVVRDKQLDDEQKEAAMQAHAKALFVQFVVITLAAAVALAVPVALVAGLEALGVVELEVVLDRTLSWQILVGATVVGVVVWKLPRGRG